MIDLFVEGMDLSGKSTITKLLVETERDIHYELQNNRLTKINPIYDFASGFNKTRVELHDGLENAVAHLFLASLIYDLQNYKEDGRHIIQDSSSLTRSIAYHTALKNNSFCDELYKMLEKFPMPKKSVYLYATIDDRIKRLEERIKINPTKIRPSDLLVKNDVKRFNVMEETLRSISCEYFKAKIINTSEKSQQQVIEEIRNML